MAMDSSRFSRREFAFAVIAMLALSATTLGWNARPTPSRPRVAVGSGGIGGGEPRSATTTTLFAHHGAAGTSRREAIAAVASAATAGVLVASASPDASNALGELLDDEGRRRYVLKFPTLFAPLYGEAYRKTIKRSLGRNDGDGGGENSDDGDIWALEQNLELGPLQAPVRCTVVRLKDGTLWVHAPVAPTEEFFDLVESCGTGRVAHVVVPTYALEHKVFVKDCVARWPDAEVWTSPGQFSFPFDGVSEEYVFGKKVAGVLGDYRSRGTTARLEEDDNDAASSAVVLPPWRDEIEYATLRGGTFAIGGKATTLSETVFFHKSSKTLIVTDCVARIPTSVPPLNDPQNLLLVSKRSTSDPQPDDTPEARLAGWKKTALLVSYFFPEHEEPDPQKFGTVTWTEGWDDNFDALAGRLIVPPVVRTLIYAQDPARVRRFVDGVVSTEDGWDFDRIVPAHFEAPIAAGPREFERAFRFLEDEGADAFPEEDLRRGLRPIADVALGRLSRR